MIFHLDEMDTAYFDGIGYFIPSQKEEKMDFDGNFEEDMELDENYCDEGGHFHPEMAPDGKDLYDAYLECTMVPSLNEQMSSPEFRLAGLECNHSYLNTHLNMIDKQIDDIQDSICDIAQEISTLTRLIEKHLFPENEIFMERKEPWKTMLTTPELFDTFITAAMTEIAIEDKSKIKYPVFIEDESEEEIQRDLKKPDDFDTQKQVEDEYHEELTMSDKDELEAFESLMIKGYQEMAMVQREEEEFPPYLFSPQEKEPVSILIRTNSGKDMEIILPDLPTALKFTEGIK